MTVPMKTCQVEMEFQDGQYLFRFGLAQIAEMEEKCGAGLGVIFARVMRGRYIGPAGAVGDLLDAGWKHVDLYEAIRLGLIGGASGVVRDVPIRVDALKARSLTEEFLRSHSWEDAWTLAAAVLSACVVGYAAPEGAKPKKAPRARRKPSTTP